MDVNSLKLCSRIYLWHHVVLDFCLLRKFFFFFTDSISLLAISLFIFSIASWFSLGRVYISKNLCISLRLTVFWHIFVYTNLLVSSLFSCHLSGYFCFIYDFVGLGPLYFSLCFWLTVMVLLFGACPLRIRVLTIPLSTPPTFLIVIPCLYLQL